MQQYRVTRNLRGIIASELFRNGSATANFYFLRYICASRKLTKNFMVCDDSFSLLAMRENTTCLRSNAVCFYRPCPGPGEPRDEAGGRHSTIAPLRMRTPFTSSRIDPFGSLIGNSRASINDDQS